MTDPIDIHQLLAASSLGDPTSQSLQQRAPGITPNPARTKPASSTQITNTQANFQRANLVEADLRGALLSGANLSEALLDGADLREALLDGADLGRANVVGADLRGADLGGADLGEAKWSEKTVWPPAWETRVRSTSTEVSAGVFEVRGSTGGRDRTSVPM